MSTYYRIKKGDYCLTRQKKKGEVFPIGIKTKCSDSKKSQVFKLADNKYSQASYYLHVTADKKTFSLKKQSNGALTALPSGWGKVAAADPNGDAGDDDSDDEEFDPPAPAEANEPSTDDPDDEDNDNQDKASSWLSKKVGGLARWIWIAIGVGVIFFILIIAMVFMGRRGR